MRLLTKGIYYAKDEDQNHCLWHECAEYKGRELTRVMLSPMEETEDTIKFQCPLCQFSYTLDKHLNL